MGAAASTKYEEELSKPLDASDLNDFDAARNEVKRLRAKLAEAMAKQAAIPEAVAIPATVSKWGEAVFDQFDTNADGKLEVAELQRAFKSLPIIVPLCKEEADAAQASMTDLMSNLDANGDGGISKEEWLVNIRACASLHARIEAGIGEDGTVTNYRDFHQQLAKREKQVMELESKESRSEEEEETLANFKKQIVGLQKRIDDRNTNLLKVKEWGAKVFDEFDKDQNGQLSNSELTEALKTLPRKKPKYAPPNTKFMTVDDMVTAMDADGDGMVSKEEWLDSISKCAGLCAALYESQVDGK